MAEPAYLPSGSARKGTPRASQAADARVATPCSAAGPTRLATPQPPAAVRRLRIAGTSRVIAAPSPESTVVPAVATTGAPTRRALTGGRTAPTSVHPRLRRRDQEPREILGVPDAGTPRKNRATPPPSNWG